MQETSFEQRKEAALQAAEKQGIVAIVTAADARQTVVEEHNYIEE
jgi:hypothetical protein